MRLTLLGLSVVFSLAALSSSAGTYLGDLSWPEADKQLRERVVVIPVGAGAKEHGPHLPLNTDQVVLEYLTDHLVKEREVVVAPPILHGWFPSFRDYPGTEVADPEVFQNYVRTVAESLVKHGVTRIAFLNTGINRATGLPLSVVARDLKADHDIHTLVVSWDDLETDATDELYEQERGGHADEGETSIMLFLAPESVDMSQAVKDYRGERLPQIGYRPGKFNRQSDVGVFGDPTLATPAKGEAILKIMQTNLILAIDQFEAATTR